MEPISRRRALQWGGAGLAATVVGGAGVVWQAGSRFTSRPGADLAEPQVLGSRGGELVARLEAVEDRVAVAGGTASLLSYNGTLPGLTLRLQGGDLLRLRLVNRLTAATNLHVHGLHVSPEGNGDNVFVRVEPGQSFDYAYQVPSDHPPGTYWYHPHLHGTVADQVFGGLYGVIVVDEPEPVPVSRERILVISDISLDRDGQLRSVPFMARMMGREGDLVLVNGQVRPRLTARPRERERWRILNACTSRYLRLRLDGQPVRLLGVDSGRYPQPRDIDDLLLLPGNRADLLLTATLGSHSLTATPQDRGAFPMMGGRGGPRMRGVPGMGGAGGASDPDGGEETPLLTLDVRGDPAPSPPAVSAPLGGRDLRGEPVTTRRTVTLGMGMGMGMGMGPGGMRFTIDGEEFDPDRVDQRTRVGTVEEWTLVNASPMDHPIHLHVWPMQLVDGAAGTTSAPVWRDVVNVPANGRTTVRIAFDDYPGRTVYHCHILDHEDNGMMATVLATAGT